MTRGRPERYRDLCSSERLVIDAMRRIGFGYLVDLRVVDGKPVLDPWPVCVGQVKLGAELKGHSEPAGDYELKSSVSDLFEHTRRIRGGRIRRIEVRHALPISIEVDVPSSSTSEETAVNRRG